MAWTIHPITNFTRFAATWDRVNGLSGRSPVLHSSVIAAALRELGSGHELLAVHEPAGVADTLAVLTPKGKGAWETFQPAQLPLGAWVMASGLNYEQVLEGLFGCLPGAVMLIGVTQQDPLIHPRPENSRTVKTLDYIQTAWVDVQGNFDSYWAQRGKNLRQNLRRQGAKLEAASLATRLEVVTEPEKVAEAIEDYGRLEVAGWKSEAGTAVHSSNAQGRFYRSIFEDFCGRDKGRIYRYRIGDKVAAMDLCIESEDVQVILKTAYDETDRHLSPASLMRHLTFRQAFEEGRIRRVEFYGRVMEWHTRWTDNVRSLYHVNRYRVGALRWLREQFA